MLQRFRVPLGFLIAAAVLYLATPTTFSVLLGLPVAVAGGIFRGLAAGVIRKDSRLATSGIYACTRNPLYFGSFLLALGFAVMSASWVAAASLLIPSALVYPPVIRKEEAHLERLFGSEFRTYCSRVPRFFPKPRIANASFSFSQYWANREYNTGLGFLGAIAVLITKVLWR